MENFCHNSTKVRDNTIAEAKYVTEIPSQEVLITNYNIFIQQGGYYMGSRRLPAASAAAAQFIVVIDHNVLEVIITLLAVVAGTW